MSNFKLFASAVAKQFEAMSKNELYRVSKTGDELWEAYLASFPEGSNRVFRSRTQHDGSYDRNVIRQIGNVVGIVDGKLVSIWDVSNLPGPYDVVAEEMGNIVKSASIVGLFRTNETQYGHAETFEKLPDGQRFSWFHFHATVSNRHQSKDGVEVGAAATTVDMFKRGLEEITPASLKDIDEMIQENSLYRGAEFHTQVKQFRKLQTEYLKLHTVQRAVWLWANYRSPVARFRNTVIGTLAVDLSEGVDTEQAVASFESKVAPTNYKRPTAVITPGMVATAMKKIEELGIESALERRHARMSDVSVNNVLWVGNSAKPKMKDGIAGLLEDTVKPKFVKSAEVVISVEDFLVNVAPKATAIEVCLSGSHEKNLMSITAPAVEGSAPLFKWGNGFAWSYNGNITDAIKEKVKKAGGNVQADLRVSLAWQNYDDLDIHCQGPYGHVYYARKISILDVDMNAGCSQSREPVENLAFMKPVDGEYLIAVNQFHRREDTGIGFTVEVESGGKVTQLHYPMMAKGMTNVVKLTLRNGQVTDLVVLDKKIRLQAASKVVWGVKTESLVPVSTIMLSPNHWDGAATGNKHWFFLLDGCINPEPVRGIYNEFLRPDLETHRKVFEVLGSKTKCPVEFEQLSGIGFSSTVRDSVIVKAVGPKLNKMYKINF